MSRKTNRAKKTEVANNYKMIQWAELGLVVILMVILIILHFVIFRYSGSLWRDEINTLNLIKLPSIIDVWQNRHFDSFPMLWLLVLRTWVFVGFGGTDVALRVLGLIIGLGILGSIWYATQSLNMRAPFISLVLFAMSPTAFVGDSLRGYGLGVLLILISLGTMWRFLRNPTPWRAILSTVSVILSVQCLYNNSFLIFAICIGAVAVGIYRRDKKLILSPLAMGALAAVSVLPYLETAEKVGDWSITFKIPVTMSLITDKLREAIDPSGTLIAAIWVVLTLMTIFIFISTLIKSKKNHPIEKKELALFLLSTMLLSAVAYVVFIKILSYSTEGWYYLPLMAVLIIIVDKGIDATCENSVAGKAVRIVCVLGIASFIFMDSWTAACTRKTNIDALASKLEAVAAKDDLIIVYPFFYGTSFAHYYKGSTEWMSLPEIKDHSIHRYDILKVIMTQNDPIKPVLQKIARTLQNGNRVWIVGGLNFLPPGEVPLQIPPAPNSIYGWNQRPYQTAWSEQTASILQIYGKTIEEIKMQRGGPVSKFEDPPLLEVRGWRP